MSPYLLQRVDINSISLYDSDVRGENLKTFRILHWAKLLTQDLQDLTEVRKESWDMKGKVRVLTYFKFLIERQVVLRDDAPSKPYQEGFPSLVGQPAGHPHCASLSAPAGLLPRSSHRHCRCRSCRWLWTRERWGTAWWCARRHLFHGPSPTLWWYCRENNGEFNISYSTLIHVPIWLIGTMTHCS